MADSSALHVLVLAGGNSTRTRTGGPKALLDLCGLPLLEHVFRAVDPLGAGQHVIVLGPKHRDPIEAWMNKAGRHVDAGGQWSIALQPEARGTGDAVACGLSELPEEGRLLILCGDTPLLTTETFQTLAEQEGDASNSPFKGLDDPAILKQAGLFAAWTPDQLVERVATAPPGANVGLQPLLGGLSPEEGWKSLKLLEATLPRLREAVAA